jgi:hypothetical protein
MRTKSGAWAAVALLILAPAAAFGWGDGGHEMVAAIAFGRLNSKAKAEVNRLLAVPVTPAGLQGMEPSDPEKRFWHAAHWPDDVKKDLPSTADEHFIDQPFSADGTALPGDLPKAKNVVAALQRHVATLQGNASDADKAMALRFIIHFVGDIHQPLHCTTRVTSGLPEGDRGGNDFIVKVRDQNGHSRQEKLHSYWDGGLGTFPKEGPHFTPPPDGEIPPAVETILREHPDTDPQITAGGPFGFQSWANESRQLGIDAAYDHLKPKGAVNSDYNNQGIEVARRRVAWAGYRLANLLNAIWKEA